MRFNRNDMVKYKDTIEALGLTRERSIVAFEAMLKGADEASWVKDDPNHKETLALAKYILDNKEEYLSL